MRILSLPWIREYWPALIGSILFVLLGILLIPYPGLQYDEVIFGPAVYQPASSVYHLKIGHHDLPLMLMSYLGATKTWIYAVIFRAWKPSLYSIRIPLILMYASTIWIFFAVLRNVHSWRAGAVGALLLATDPVYVLTGAFAWCNLQNVLMVAAIGCLVKFHTSGKRLWLGAGMFCTGLWLWDKAVALWMLSGFAIALLLVFRRQTMKHITARNLTVAFAGLCLGALPLIIYNVENDFPTLRSNAHFSTAGFDHKLEILKITANGSAWLGYFVNEPSAPAPRLPRTWVERRATNLHDWLGDSRRDFMPYACLASLLLIPVFLVLQRSAIVRLLLFCLLVSFIAWIQMALTEGAGTGGHHAALMWPFPYLFIAAALAEASLRWKAGGGSLLAAAAVVLMTANLLTVNQYLYQLARFGGAASWSDAIYQLSAQTSNFQDSPIMVSDWGILNPLATLHRERLPLEDKSELFVSASPSEIQKQAALEAFADRNSVWVGHTDGYETFPGVNAHVDKMAAAAGYRKTVLSTIADGNGRSVFEIFRIAPSAQAH